MGANASRSTRRLTYRPISRGAERWMFKPQSVLDHGSVTLTDYLGNDRAVEEAARNSYGKGSRRITETEGLIRFLRRHRHTTPSEMVEVKFHCVMPIFVARQWVRHRMASINEFSGRYGVMPDVIYVPKAEVIALQARGNKQGRGEQADPALRRRVRGYIAMSAAEAYAHYTAMLESGVARELARVVLPTAYYTQWYWKIDLHNLLHFLSLRLDDHAQYEIRMYAEAIARVTKAAFPMSWRAFVDYQLESRSFSRLELDALRSTNIFLRLPQLAKAVVAGKITNHRERREFIVKLNELDMIERGTAAAFSLYCRTLGLKPKTRADERAFFRELELLD